MPVRVPLGYFFFLSLFPCIWTFHISSRLRRSTVHLFAMGRPAGWWSVRRRCRTAVCSLSTAKKWKAYIYGDDGEGDLLMGLLVLLCYSLQRRVESTNQFIQPLFLCCIDRPYPIPRSRIRSCANIIFFALLSFTVSSNSEIVSLLV